MIGTEAWISVVVGRDGVRASRDSKYALRRSRCAFAIEAVGVTLMSVPSVKDAARGRAVSFPDSPETSARKYAGLPYDWLVKV